MSTHISLCLLTSDCSVSSCPTALCSVYVLLWQTDMLEWVFSSFHLSRSTKLLQLNKWPRQAAAASDEESSEGKHRGQEVTVSRGSLELSQKPLQPLLHIQYTSKRIWWQCACFMEPHLILCFLMLTFSQFCLMQQFYLLFLFFMTPPCPMSTACQNKRPPLRS